MKKSLLALSLACVLGTGAIAFAPVRDDKKPITADKLAVAEEVIEYENQTSTQEACENCTFICVEGKAKISVSPDKAKICAMIETIGGDLASSKNDVMQKIDNVFSALKNGGAEEDNICLDFFRCLPSYDFSNGKNLVGYVTTASFCLDVDNIDNVQNFVDIMTENGVTSICDISYEVSNMEEEYSNALSQAFENAKQKASALLATDDVRLVKITEEHTFAPYALCRNREALSADYVGKIDITARVRAVFETSQN